MAQDPNLTPGTEDERSASLETRLRAARRAEDDRTAEPQAPFGMASDGSRTGQRVLSILVGYPIGGGVVGWFLDTLLHTRPWIMLALLFLGFAAACRSVFRISKGKPD